jgi:D-glycero-alpha-D-manno-heptose-7-phosphate kinase
MMVVLISLLKEWRELSLTNHEMAQMAHDIERRDLGIPGGYQDQYAAIFGGFNFLELTGSQVVVNPLPLSRDIVDELETNMLLAYTGRARRGGDIIADQTGRLEAGVEDALAGLRAQKQLAGEMKDALARCELRRFAEMLDAAWQAKKRMSPKISTPVIDEMYDEAKRLGAIGGKVTGAGGGGYMIFYCHYDRKHLVAERLIELGASVDDFAFTLEGVRAWTVEADA